MKNNELNEMLVKEFPGLSDKYIEETQWQDGDHTGSHIVYGDVFTPYISKCIEEQNEKKIKHILSFLEFLLSKEDAYVDEVVAFSVIESIEHVLNQEHIAMMGNKTKKILNEIRALDNNAI